MTSALPALPPRPRNGHKGTFGHVLCLGGSLEYPGAAVLCARAVLRGGAGLVTLGYPAFLRPVIGPACNRCAQCVGVCRVDAIDTHHGYDIVPAECTVCLDCLVACPESAALRQAQGGIGFQWFWRPAPLRGAP